MMLCNVTTMFSNSAVMVYHVAHISMAGGVIASIISVSNMSDCLICVACLNAAPTVGDSLLGFFLRGRISNSI